VNDLPISFVELTIDVNGEEEKVNQFVSSLENLKRIIHVQSYEYKINKEKGNRLEGIVTIRAFYSEKLAEFVDEKMDFELDYEFDPQKVKRYVDPNEQS
jgi:Tfp pilus assembly protein PilO